MNDKHFSSTNNLVLIMSESFRQLFSNKWKNIQYDFNHNSNNYSLNVNIGAPVKGYDNKLV